MAELALAASIIQLADIGAKLSLNLFGLADSVRSASSEARLIATEVSLFSHALRSLGKTLEKKLGKNKSSKRIARRILKSCRGIIVELSALADEIEAQHGGMARLVNGFKWTFKRTRVTFLRTSLESLKSTMLLFLASIELAKAQNSKASAEDSISPLQDQVETMMKVTEITTAGLVEAAHECGNTHEESSVPQLTDNADASLKPVPETRSALSADSEILEASILVAQSNDAAVPQLGKLVLHSAFSLLPLGAINLDIAAQQSAYQFATEILCQIEHVEREPDQSTHREKTLQANYKDAISSGQLRKNETSSNTSTQTAKASSNNAENESNSASNVEKHEANSDPMKHNHTPPSQIPQSTKGTFDALDALDVKVAQELAPILPAEPDPIPNDPTPAIQVEAEHAHNAREAAISNGQAIASERVTGDLLTDTFLANDRTIEFMDATGTVHIVPWEIARTWSGMQRKIRELFLHTSPLSAGVQKGHYHLIGPDGHWFPSFLWEQCILPWMAIRMQMWVPPTASQRGATGIVGMPMPPPPPPRRSKKQQKRTPAVKTRIGL